MKIFVGNNAIFRKEKVVKANVGQWIAKLLENSEIIAKAPKITVPAIKFDREETKV